MFSMIMLLRVFAGLASQAGEIVRAGLCMNKKGIHITQYDLERLKKLLHSIPGENHLKDVSVRELADELARGIIVSPKEVPENVITMNSRVLLRDVDSGEERTCWLVFPDKIDAVKNSVSILSPLGTAMIGYRVGDVFTWESPSGVKQMRVLDILYQPERVGNFSL
jgi:regulator of nucleoside diphosphate kinase